MPTDYMYVIKCGADEEFKQGQLSRYGNIELSPSAGVLNYGQVVKINSIIRTFIWCNTRLVPWQGLFEGTKAYRREDERLFLFRPQQNAIRMQIGAERMCMPSPSTQLFVDAVKRTVLANRRWVILFYKHFGLYALRMFFLSIYIFVCWIRTDSSSR